MILTKKVCIIGGGVSGLSCALLLQERGWQVTIISADDPRKPVHSPSFSSLFPAASIIPHTISSDMAMSLFKRSQHHFKSLMKQNFPGLQIHSHFELFTGNHPKPNYLRAMENVREWPEFKQDFYPHHPQIPVTSGWSFHCYFADWGLYFPALINRFLEAKGKLKIMFLHPEDIQKLPFDLIINCSEAGAQQLFGDENGLLYRGHLLQILDAPKLKDPADNVVSYNFSPGAEVYSTQNGTSQDVYCYPRSDGWILGGSRQQGQTDKHGNWTGDTNIPPTVKIDGTEIPAQILQLHSAIIEYTFGLKVEDFTQRKTKTGYRYVRNKENGLRLESEQIGDKLIIHNYGHGGAGVTLSWGCAEKVAEMLTQQVTG